MSGASPSSTTARVVVVGGGVAGLASAWHLARAGVDVTLLERETLLASHASGRNAAIFRSCEPDPLAGALALRSRALMAELESDAPLLRPTGALYLGRRATLDALAASARTAGATPRALKLEEAVRRVPALAGTDAEAALECASDGVLDNHALCAALAKAARRAGARLRSGATVRQVHVERGAVRGVLLEDGAALEAEQVVLAAGAWAAELGASAGAALPLVPLRRHLVQLEGVPSIAADGPVVWRVDVEGQVYFRPESGGVLTSPCDEEPWPPGVPPASPAALEALGPLLARCAPPLAAARVRRAWACLRTFAPDRGFVAGPDGRVAGLWWMAALGGHGMSCALGLAELALSPLLGVDADGALPGAERASPARL